jgi:hypothetical protein
MDDQLQPRLTPDRLRSHAEAERSPTWDGQARQLLLWAADLLEAAERAIEAERASGATKQ